MPGQTPIDNDFISSVSQFEELLSSRFYKEEEEPSYRENINHINNVYCSEGQVDFWVTKYFLTYLIQFLKQNNWACPNFLKTYISFLGTRVKYSLFLL